MGLFNIGGEPYFMYQGYFDTDFDKYTEDAVAIFGASGLTTVFENLEGFPMDWKTNAPAFVKYRARPSCPKLSGIRRVSVCQRRRSQESAQSKERAIRHARPDAVTRNGCIGQDLRISATPADRSSNPE